ncbi:hypothetical protein HFD88_002699 [Aspergillus terreus]|nr:hypothetical protein HFD88_002699 [Aspergillus terreus]
MPPITLLSSRFEASPQSSRQWRCLLQEVKLLYIQRQYKQCATRAFDILHMAQEPIHPVYSTYLYFYSAISYEAMGRAAHDYSNKKLSLLHSALDCFVTCSAVLPGPIEEDDRGSSQCSFSDSLFSDRPSSAGSFVSITGMTHKGIDSADDDPFISDTDTAVETLFKSKLRTTHAEPKPDKPRLIPAPLKVYRSTDNQTAQLHPLKLATSDPDNSTPSKTPSSTTERPVRARPPPLPIKIVPFGTSSPRARRREAPKPSTRVQTPSAATPQQRGLPARKSPHTPRMPDPSVTRYNSSLRSLRVEINASIAAIHALIDETTELQEARRATRNFRRSASFWSFSPVKDGSMRARETPVLSGRGAIIHETKEQRIARLRADGWNTVGLKAVQRGWKGAEYYQAYCTAVLSELYLER